MRKKRKTARRTRPLFEELEQRLLFSADFDPGLFTSALPDTSQIESATVIETSVEPAFDSSNPEISLRHELIFVDTSVSDYQQLVDDILTNQGDDRRIDVVLLDSQRDGIQQISDILADYQGLDAVHLISHGSDGSVDIGNTQLDAESLSDNVVAISRWADAFSENGDFLIYGCSLAATGDGQGLVDALSQLTQTDVAGSDDLTGNAHLGGDWEMEYQAGQIDTRIAISTAAQEHFEAVLDDTVLESYEPSNSQMPDGLYEIKSDQSWGQTYSYNSGAGTYEVNKLQVMLSKASTAPTNQTITVTLRDDSSNDALLGDSTLSSDIVTTSEAWYIFDIGSVTLNDSTVYTIKVESDGGGEVYLGVGDPSSYGNGDLLDDAGSTESEKDAAFKIIDSNNAPTASDSTVSTIENNAYTFSAEDFKFSDVDGDTLASAHITSLESVGELKLSGADVLLNQSISRTDIDAGNLTYIPTSNTIGVPYDSFGFTVWDDTEGSASAYTMTVGVVANDAPVATNDPSDYNTMLTALNPLGYWQLGDTVGSTDAADTGSATNDGTYNGPTLGVEGAITGSSNTAADFNRAAQDYVEIAHDPAYLLDNGTVQLWFNADDLAADQTLISKDSESFDTGGHLDITLLATGEIKIRLQSTTNNYYITTSSAGITADNWHHVVLGVGDQGMQLYLDGALVGSNSYTGGLGTTSGSTGNFEPLVIGASTFDSDNLIATPLTKYFDGQIDEVAIIGSQISTQQIQQLYNSSQQPYLVAQNTSLNISAAEGVLANDTDLDGDTLTVTTTPVTNVSNGVLTLNTDGSFSYTPTIGFSGIDTFVYEISDGNGGTDTATVTITIDEPPTLDLDANDSSGSTGANFVTSYTEDAAAVNIVDTDALLTDGDDTNLSSLTVTLTNALDGADEALSFDATGTSIVGAYSWDAGAGTGTLRLNGSDTVANYQQVLRTLTYQTSSQSPDTTDRIITIIANDGSLDSNLGTTTVTVAAINDVPVANPDPGDYNATLNVLNPLGYWQLGDTLGSANAADTGSAANNGTYHGPTLGVAGAITGSSNTAANFNRAAQAYVEIAHNDAYLLDNGTVQLWFNADDLAAKQTLISKDSSGYDTGGHLDISLLTTGEIKVRLQSTTNNYYITTSSVGITADNWHHVALGVGDQGMQLYLDGELVGSNSYTGGLGTTSGGTGNFEPLVIGAGTGNSGNLSATPLRDYFDGQIDEFAIIGTQLNISDIKTLYSAGIQNYEITEEGTLTVSDAFGVLINDSDADGDLIILNTTPTTNVSNGTLTLNADGSFNYTPNANFSGTDTFVYEISDGNGGSSQGNVTITVNAVNDAPAIEINSGFTLDEGTSGTITNTVLKEGDPDDSGTGSIYTLTTAPSHGSLNLNGTALDTVTNKTFTQDDIDNSRITYTHDGTAISSDSFGFTLSDGGENGVSPLTAQTFAITVTPIVSTMTWDGGGVTNNWSDATNWVGDVIPDANDVVIFDATSEKNSVVDAGFAGTIGGITLNAGYSGTLSLATDLTIDGDLIQNAGIFDALSQSLDVNGDISLNAGTLLTSTNTTTLAGDLSVSGGTYEGKGTLEIDGADTQTINTAGQAVYGLTINKSSGTLTLLDTLKVKHDFTHTLGTVDASASTVIIASSWPTNSSTIDTGSIQLNDVIFDVGSNDKVISGTMKIVGDLTIESVGILSGGSIEVAENVTTKDGIIYGDTTIIFMGSGNQILDANGGIGELTNVRIDKTGGILILQDTLQFNGGFDLAQGTVDAAAATVTFQTRGVSLATLKTGNTVFNGLTLDLGSHERIIDGSLDVNGDLNILSSSVLTAGKIKTTGNVTLNGNLLGDTTFVFDGTGDQTVNAPSGTGALASVSIDKADGTLTLQDTLKINGNFTHVSGDVNAATSSIIFITDDNTSATLDTGNISFNDVTFDIGSHDRNIVGTLDINGDLSILTANDLNGGEIRVAGNITSNDTFVFGTTTLRLDGTGEQTIGGNNLPHGDVTIDKASGSVVLADDLVLNGTNQDLYVLLGTFDLAGHSIDVTGNSVNLQGGIIQANGTITGDLNISSGGTLAFDINGVNANEYDTLTVSGTLTADINDSHLTFDLLGLAASGTASGILNQNTLSGSFTDKTYQNNTKNYLTTEQYDANKSLSVVFNTVPVITGGDTASVSVAENTIAATTVTATDADTLTYSIDTSSIGAGIDGALFDINPTTGELTFKTAPDFELPSDNDGNNVYEVTVEATDLYGESDSQTISITVTDMDGTLTVDTTRDANDSNIVEGNTAHTIEWLNAHRGTDNAISLREAIIAANNTSGIDTISFSIAGAGPHTINVTSALPSITDAIVIDGSSDGAPVIELNGTEAGAVNGLLLAAGSDGSTIRGLVINRFGDDGIEVNSSGNTIVGNYIGTNVTGTDSIGFGNADDGVQINSAANEIGGANANERNIISGNSGDGINISDVGSSNNTIQGNYIGTDINGTVDLGNTDNGITINGGSSNIIGTNLDGTDDGSEGNLISGNNRNGIQVKGSTANGNFIRGNTIGINLDGTAALRNETQGIQITGGATHTTIGGTVADAANIVGGNRYAGIELRVTGTSGNTIQGNYIGTDSANADFGNSLGVKIWGGVSDNIVGGIHPGEANTIAFNTNDGIYVLDNGMGNNALLGNLIYSNGDLGIDLGNTGVTDNDSGDADTGPNDLQNFPELASATTTGTDVIISGSLNSSASTNFRIEFFASAAADGSGHGEAERYLGYTNVTTDGSGNVAFTDTITATVATGESITATATVSNATFDTFFGTSEFAQNVSPNVAPVALDDTGSVDEDATLTVSKINGVIDNNDTDVEGNTLTVSAILAGPESGSGTSGTIGSGLVGGYGTLTLNADGSYNYVADQAAANALALSVTATDTYTYTVSDGNSGTDTAEIVITITGTNDAAVIDGTDMGAVTEDADQDGDGLPDALLETNGTLTISDADSGEAVFTAGTLNGTYGNLTLDGTGDWSYSAINAQAIIQNLADGTTLTDTITISSADGSTHDVVITITGINDAPTLTATAIDPTFSERGAAQTLFSATAMSTIEAGQSIEELVFTVSNVTDGADEIINIDGTSVELTDTNSGSTTNGYSYSVSLTGTATTVTLDTTGTASADIQTLVDGLSYQNNSEDPTVANRVVTLTSIKDSGATANGGVDTTILSVGSTVTISATNDAPTLTSFTTVVDTTLEDTAVEITLADLKAQGDGADLDGTVEAFVVQSVSTGTLMIGTSAGTATAWTATTNDTIDATHHAYWTAATDATGTFNAFAVLAEDDLGALSTGNVVVQVSSTPVGDTPTVADISTDEDTQSGAIVIDRHANDGAEVTHFKITGITNGTLTLNDGVTAVSNDDFITVAQGNAGLKFTPTLNSTVAGSFDVEASENGTSVAAQSGAATSTITINGLNDAPTLTSFTTVVDTTLEDTAVEITLADLKVQGDGADLDGTVEAFVVQSVSTGTLMIGTSAGTATAWTATTNDTIDASYHAYWTPASHANGTLNAFDVVAEDNLGAVSTGNVVVQVATTAVGDTPTVADISTDEDTQSGAIVIDRHANDGAEVTHFKITGITNGTLYQNDGTTVINEGDYITYDQGNAGLKFTPSLNSTAAGSFTVEASEDGTSVALQSGTATSTITINSLNDAPIFGGDNTGSVTKDVAVAAGNISTSGALTISDPDAGESSFQAATVVGAYGSLSIDAAGAWSYSADNNQGAIQALDAGESITDTLTVTTFDGTTHNVVITINGSDDATVIGGTITGSVSEDGTLTSTGALTISDTDTSDLTDFADVAAIASDNGYGTFEMSGNNWTYTLDNTDAAVQALDVTETLTDTYTFTAPDGVTQKVTVTINGTEDTPVFDSTAVTSATEDALYSYSISTNDVDGEAVTLTAPTLPSWLTFTDHGNGTATLSGTPTNTDVGDHAMVLNVSDGTLNSDQSFTITVGNTNDAPVINDATFSINENSPAGTTVGNVSVLDLDLGDTHNYSITTGNTGLAFAIDDSGNLTVNDSSALDFETNPVFTLTVEVRDLGGSGLLDLATIIVNLNDLDEYAVGAISDSNAATDRVAEDATPGTSVGINALTDDPDGTDTVSYSLSDDAGGLFTIDANTGIVTVYAALDAETVTSHNITVLATSSDTSTSTQSYTIAITDVDEFDVGMVTDNDGTVNTVAEDITVGTTVGITAFASDTDVDGAITYSLNDDAGGLFTIDGTTGVVTIASALDYETATSHNITVLATSDDTSTSSQVFNITVTDVNDTAPVITATQTFSVSELAANTTSLGNAVATDADTSSAFSAWTITAGNIDGVFAIDGATGEITVADNSDLDFDTIANYSLSLTVSDGTNTSAVARVAITVSDVATAITAVQSFTISESDANGTAVGTVVTNRDTPVSFTITGGNVGSAFAIDNSGNITVADTSVIDYETLTNYTLTIEASDGTTPVTESITINITNVDEFDVGAIIDSNSKANTVDNSSALPVEPVAETKQGSSPESENKIEKESPVEVEQPLTVNITPAIAFHNTEVTEFSITLPDREKTTRFNTPVSQVSKTPEILTQENLETNNVTFNSSMLDIEGFWSALDDLKREMDKAPVSQNEWINMYSKAAGVTLSVGVLSWLARAGSLATSLMSSLPLWSWVDPVPVLAMTGVKKTKYSIFSPNKNNEELPDKEQLPEQMFTHTYKPSAHAPTKENHP